MSADHGPAADPRALGRKAAKERTERKQREADLQIVVGSDQGRRVLAWLVADLCRFTKAYDVPLTAEAAQFDDGRRAVGASVMAAVRAVCGREAALQLGAECLSLEPASDDEQDAEASSPTNPKESPDDD